MLSSGVDLEVSTDPVDAVILETTETVQSGVDYSALDRPSLLKLARTKKIPGYFRLSDEQLTEQLEELDDLDRARSRRMG